MSKSDPTEKQEPKTASEIAADAWAEIVHENQCNGGPIGYDKEIAITARHISAAYDELKAENERLRSIIISDGLDPDLPIPPGLNVHLKRAEQEIARLHTARLQVAEAVKAQIVAECRFRWSALAASQIEQHDFDFSAFLEGEQKAEAGSNVEQRLYDITLYLHRMSNHNQDFERCESEQCILTREALDIQGYGHRFDEDYKKAVAEAESEIDK